MTPIWPMFNASLNGLSAILLTAGFCFIRLRRIPQHKTCMIAAFAISTVFLISYLAYHAHHGATRFQGQGAIRTIYFAILMSHTILATVVAVMAPMTLVRALKGNFERHRRLARWTLPLWFYVSVTGVLVYLMLYQL